MLFRSGEFYLDSLAVYPEYRGRGIAKQLLKRFIDHAASISLPAALLVDKGNPNAERLYKSIGFVYANDAMWVGTKCDISSTIIHFDFN